MRVSLSKCLEKYVHEPKCKACGGDLTLDTYRQSHRETKNYNCNCDGIHHVHRRGSKWCNHYKGEYTQEDLRERHLI